MADPVDVHVSLVNTNNRELLRACLETLPDACAGLDWRVTVFDNASDDGSADMVVREFPWASVHRSTTRRGFSQNHNVVLREAVGGNGARYVLILNEDTELEPRSVRELVAFADARPALGAVGPIISEVGGGLQPSLLPYPSFANQLLPRLVAAEAGDRPGWLNGSCVLVRADALRRVGLLDERFFIFYEDTDLGARLATAGYESAVCPSARILHHGHSTVSRPAMSSSMEKQMLRSRYLYFAKHRGHSLALTVSALGRLVLGVRAAKALATASVRRDANERRRAALLLNLGLYDPARALPHEFDRVSEPR